VATPQPAPGSQPFTAAGLEDRAWQGTWELHCKDASVDGGAKDQTKTGPLEVRFSGNKAKLTSKNLYGDAAKEGDAPMDVELDPLGAFLLQEKNEGGSASSVSGQFQTVTVEGQPRPTGHGEYHLAIDLSFLAGMLSMGLTLGASGGEMPELTPEQREQMTIHCDGKWELPAS
jgi:hypothetical protein